MCVNYLFRKVSQMTPTGSALQQNWNRVIRIANGEVWRASQDLCKGYDIISETGTEAAPQPGTIIQTSNLYRLAIQYVRQVKQQILTKLISWPLSSAIVSLLDQKMVIICGYVIRRWHHSRHKQVINLVLSHLATLACQKSSPKGSHPRTLAVHSWIFTTWVSNASNK